MKCYSFSIKKYNNGTALISRLTIRNFEKPLTALCLRKGNNNENLRFGFFAYPGDVNSSEVRRYKFSLDNSPLFQFNSEKSSQFDCRRVKSKESYKSAVHLQYKYRDAAFLTTENFNDTYCCHPINGKKDIQGCAIMKISHVSKLL